MADVTEPAIETLEGEAVLSIDRELLSLSVAAFDSFSDSYLLERLPLVDGRAVVTARDAARRLIGFKLGYRRGSMVFYSWLGAVHPEARRQGVAQRLMAAQHQWATLRGYSQIETRTRAENSAMIIANLKGGFRIVGFESDRAGYLVVTQRAELAPGSTTSGR